MQNTSGGGANMKLAKQWLATAIVSLGLLIGIGSTVAAETQATSGAAVADPATWGIYAQLVGTDWSGAEGNAQWRWGPDNTIVESRTFQMKTVIRAGANRGELVSVYGGGLHTYDGRIAADGSIPMGPPGSIPEDAVASVDRGWPLRRRDGVAQ